MGIEQLTYVDMAERLNISADAARALARRMQLPRQKANDGKTLIAVDLSEIRNKPSPMVRRADMDALRAQIAELRELVTKAEAMADRQRADYERERERAEHLAAELQRIFAELVVAKEKAGRLEGELAILRALPWWLRLLNYKPTYAAHDLIREAVGAH
jgi:polyhydroxyalkanoate synthesis regulator phasin